MNMLTGTIFGLVALAIGLSVLVTWRDRGHLRRTAGRKHGDGVSAAHERATTRPPTLGSVALGWSDGGTRSPGRSRGY